jgi:hypothetical protein
MNECSDMVDVEEIVAVETQEEPGCDFLRLYGKGK